ncbi:hypothetical protein [Acidihalobacter prosperus]|uniref:Uncharacterized protein n=1 Tax=Acidihalobacter prosperus TaxID=160660 RepID=A0A1A6C1G5_9GAMM|nr:hypothetical protein [Acidihalobacter prosperus]OBS08411.1 hypothetical protein Thpro_022661 [Acidihalobacter prosperus]
MKHLRDFDPEELHHLLSEENWLAPLPEVRPIKLKPWQETVFWGLRLYVLVMLLVVLWAFVHGAHG